MAPVVEKVSFFCNGGVFALVDLCNRYWSQILFIVEKKTGYYTPVLYGMNVSDVEFSGRIFQFCQVGHRFTTPTTRKTAARKCCC